VKKMQQQEFKDLISLRENGAGSRFMEFLRESLDLIRKDNDTLEDVELYRSQGKAQVLNEILDSFDNAMEHLGKFSG